MEVHKRYMGRGPTKARALSGSDVVVLLMENGLTAAQKTAGRLQRRGGGDPALDLAVEVLVLDRPVGSSPPLMVTDKALS